MPVLFKINCGCGHVSTTLADAVRHVEKTGHKMHGGDLRVQPFKTQTKFPFRVLANARDFFRNHGYENEA